jgi:hypothetical protein
MKVVYVGPEPGVVVVPQPPPLGEVIAQRGVPVEIEDSVAHNLLARRDWRKPSKKEDMPAKA